MPKRDDAYMSAQRDTIARAAMDCMLETGLHGTSLRDICKQAGISIGALYTHFRTIEEVFVAACELDSGPPETVVSTWAAYVARLRQLKDEVRDEHLLRRFRISLQFMAEMTRQTENPPGLSDLYARNLNWIRDSLQAISGAGEIELPLGLEMTAATHRRLIAGTLYVGIADRDQDFGAAIEEMLVAISFTVGRKAKAPAASRRKPKG